MSALVSVVIPAYNAERWIAETLRSVFSQTYPHWEIILIDDGSLDESVVIATDLAREVSQHVEVISTTNHGVSSARNLGISKARGDFIAFIDSDDLWHPDKLSSQVEFMEKNDDVLGVGCWYEVVDESNEKVLSVKSVSWERASIRSWMAFESGGPLLPSTLVLKTSALTQVGFFDESLSTAADTDFAWRLVMCGTVGTICRPLTRYRTSPGQMHRNLALLDHDYLILYAKAPFVNDPGLIAQTEANMFLVTGVMEIRRRAFRSGIGILWRALVTHPALTTQDVIRRAARWARPR